MRFVKDYVDSTTDKTQIMRIVTIYGSHSETKPTIGIYDGSVFIETDTHDVYLFDEKNQVWRKV